MNGRYVQKVGTILQMAQLKNCKTYYSKTIALFIMEAKNDKEVNWVGMLF